MCKKFFILGSLIIMSAGCDWVDSTGVQSGDSGPPILLDEGQVVPLTENRSRTLDPGASFDTSGAEHILSWDETPLQQGRLPGCAGVENFASEFAASTLAEACFDEDECEMYFEPVIVSDEQGDRDGFMLTPPVLKAPVGLTYQLISTGPDGLNSQANFTFCLIAENEPPVANEDIYPVVEKQSLMVSSAGVLSNDTDDTETDIRNQPLSVVLPVLSEPTLAESFELFADGSFSYTPDPAIVLAPGTTQADIFEYEITDGTYTDTAIVRINIVAADAPPILLEPIPDSQAIVGIRSNISLSEYFNDPEAGDLTYSVVQGSLPPSGNFTLNAVGVLSGTAEPQDVGDWTILVSATDVSAQTASADFVLTVINNLPPVSQTIPAQTANTGELFMLDTSLYFNDPEQVGLSYSLTGAESESIAIDRVSGTISGFFSFPGVYNLTVSVSDGVNQPVSSTVAVTVVSKANQAPTHTGLIANQSVEVNTPIVDIQGNFTDPDGDTLTYTMRGALPPGVSLSPATGVISGSPNRTGVFPDLRIRAADPDGASALSDSFTLTVTAATPNRKPVYLGEIANQTVSLGAAIVPVEGSFFDPDEDPLTYSMVGQVPAGLSLSEDGVLTGRPLRVTTAAANLRIRVTDPGGLIAQSDLFRITVTAAPPTTVNQKPEYIGSIRDRIVSVGTEMLPISGDFTDPDGDTLVYRLVGTLPRGITFSTVTGVIRGAPTVAVDSSLLRIVATDPSGAAVSSDRFTIFVR